MQACTKCDRLEREVQEIRIDIKDVYGKLYQNEKMINGTEIKLNAIIRSIDELKLKLDKLSDIPAKRWDTVIGTMIAVIITAILTYVLKG